MQLRSKIISGLLVTAMALTMAPLLEAQINLTLYANGSAKEIQTSRNALTNDRSSVGSGVVVSGALLAASPLTSTTLTLTYPAAITSDGVGITGGANIPSGDALRLAGATGLFASASIITVNFTAGTVSLGLTGFDTASNSLSGSMRLVGVRIDATDLTAPGLITASLSNTANNYVLSTTSMTGITALGAGIASLTQSAIAGTTDNGVAQVFTNGVIGDANASLLITEGFVGAWRTTAQESNSGITLAGNAANSHVILTFTGIPDGVTLTLSVAAQDETTGAAISDATLTSTAGDNDSIISFTDTDLTDTGLIQIDVAVSLITPTPSSVTAATITVNANMGPQGTAHTTTANITIPMDTGGYPRYSTAATSEITVASVTAASTSMLVPYVVYDGLAGGYDTGISIANTSTDPFSPSATAGSGTVTFYFYPRTTTGAGTAFSLTTATGTTPGVGMATDGTIASGGTWSGLLSELLTSASQTGAFTGYIFIKTNFILAHGTSYVTNFATFTSASPMLVLQDTQAAPRTGFESLSQ